MPQLSVVGATATGSLYISHLKLCYFRKDNIENVTGARDNYYDN